MTETRAWRGAWCCRARWATARRPPELSWLGLAPAEGKQEMRLAQNRRVRGAIPWLGPDLVRAGMHAALVSGARKRGYALLNIRKWILGP